MGIKKRGKVKSNSSKKDKIITKTINRKYLILDLDQTLLHSYTPNEYKKKKKKIEEYTYKKMLDNKREVLYYVVKRPGLDNFIKRMLKKYIVLIWTAATQSYGEWVVHNILHKKIKEQKFIRNNISNGEYYLLLHNDHGDKAQEKMKMKKIGNRSSKPLEYMYNHPSYKKYLNKYNTVLIDDALHVKKNQISNVININEFHVGDVFDNMFTKKIGNKYTFDEKIDKKFNRLKNDEKIDKKFNLLKNKKKKKKK